MLQHRSLGLDRFPGTEHRAARHRAKKAFRPERRISGFGRWRVFVAARAKTASLKRNAEKQRAKSTRPTTNAACIRNCVAAVTAAPRCVSTAIDGLASQRLLAPARPVHNNLVDAYCGAEAEVKALLVLREVAGSATRSCVHRLSPQTLRRARRCHPGCSLCLRA